MANQNIPVNEKYMLSINEAASTSTSGSKKCAGWQKITWEYLLFTAETGISLFAVSLKNSFSAVRQEKEV